MFTLIRGARVLAPAELGRRDVLLAAGLIAKMAEKIEPPSGLEVEVVEAGDKILTPGFIDLHVHLIGGGGEGGPATRVPEIQLGQITAAGVTTVLGVLGTDDVTRRPETLLAKAQALEQEGISAYIMVGSYAFPPAATITGSLKKDIALIPQVVGVGEVAISDHRSAQPSYEDLVKLAAEARVGGLLGGKAGLVQLHMGSGKTGLSYLFRLIEETEIPIGQFLPTHVTREAELFRQAVRFAQQGGNLDITAAIEGLDMALSPAGALDQLRAAGVPLERVTFSSDSNGSLPRFDEKGNLLGLAVGRIDSLTAEFRRLILEHGLAPAEILKAFTLNPARRIKLDSRKGSLKEGKDADLILFDRDWSIDRVWARGRLMVAGGRAQVRGAFEAG